MIWCVLRLAVPRKSRDHMIATSLMQVLLPPNFVLKVFAKARQLDGEETVDLYEDSDIRPDRF
jgi:hypothetical protein